jgi:hypothetical protein
VICSVVAGKKLEVFFPARKAVDVHWEMVQVSELSSKKELPVIFLSLPAREQATIHILLP